MKRLKDEGWTHCLLFRHTVRFLSQVLVLARAAAVNINHPDQISKRLSAQICCSVLNHIYGFVLFYCHLHDMLPCSHPCILSALVTFKFIWQSVSSVWGAQTAAKPVWWRATKCGLPVQTLEG